MSTDISLIAKSRIRRDLLALFFSKSDQKHYVRELEKILNYSAGNIRRELIRLKSGKLLITERVGNLVMYSLDLKHPFYEELKKIIFKTIGIEYQLKELLEVFPEIKHAFLYGSFATGEENMRSDVDIALIGKMDENKFIEKLKRLEKKIEREINYTLYSLESFEKELKHRGSFLQKVYTGKIIVLKGNKVE